MKKENIDSVIDGHKIHLHPQKSAVWRELGDCYPIHIEIGVTSRCNQRCVFCALDFIDHKGIDIDKKVMLKSLEEMANPKIPLKITFKYGEKTQTYYDGVRSVMFGGEGEPTLHKDIGLFVQKAKESGLDVALTTNGVGFDKKLQEQCLPYLSWIKFSIDAGNPKTYNKVHRVPEKNFEKLMKNISNSVDLKRKNNLDVVIGTQFLMIPQNSNKEEAQGIINKLSQINPDYLSIKPYSNHPRSGKDLIVNPQVYNELEKIFNDAKESVDFKIEFRKATIERIKKGADYKECLGLPFISLIDSKGNILPCNLFYGVDKLSYGNLYEQSFSEIWSSEKRKEVLSKLKEKGVENCRKGCRCDSGNRYLDRLKRPQLHDKFT